MDGLFSAADDRGLRGGPPFELWPRTANGGRQRQGSRDIKSFPANSFPPRGTVRRRHPLLTGPTTGVTGREFCWDQVTDATRGGGDVPRLRDIFNGRGASLVAIQSDGRYDRPPVTGSSSSTTTGHRASKALGTRRTGTTLRDAEAPADIQQTSAPTVQASGS